MTIIEKKHNNFGLRSQNVMNTMAIGQPRLNLRRMWFKDFFQKNITALQNNKSCTTLLSVVWLWCMFIGTICIY